MTTISSITTKSTSTTPAAASAAAASAADIQSSFLTLLVSQLQNQDPLNPMDNSQLTSQLAQISTVSGIQNLNATMTALAASLGAGQNLQASNLVGHDVMVAGNQLALANGSAAGGFTAPQAVDDLVVTIRGADGTLVRTVDLGAQAAGTGAFQWDGKNDAGVAVAPGSYTFQLHATSGTTQVTMAPLMAGLVTGVVPGTNGGATQVQLGLLGSFSLSQVVEIN